MSERFSWATTETGGDVGVEDARIALAALLTPGPALDTNRNGIMPGTGDPYRVLATTPTASGNVTVNGGHMAMRASRGTGSYVQTLSPVSGFGKTINILSTPADPTNNRNDLIIAQQSDKFYGDSANQYLIKQVVGTPSGTPIDPTVTGSPDYFTLARVVVRAGTSSILGTDITDLRPPWVVALGGVLPVTGATDRATIPTPYNGYTIWRQDRAWIEVYDGTVWRVRGVAICSSVSDRNTAITNPFAGQLAITTDTNYLWRYTGSAWVAVAYLGGNLDLTWQTGFTFSNGWSSGTPTASYRLCADGFVRLRGLFVPGTRADATVIATLPTGYRPTVVSTTYAPLTGANSAVVKLQVNTDGTIQLFTETGTYNGATPAGNLVLDQVSFSVV